MRSALAITLLAVLAPAAMADDGGIVSIGEIGETRVTLDQGTLRAADPAASASPGSRPIWIVSCEEIPGEAGNPRSWLIRYSAWRAGDYDLRDLLHWSDGVSKAMVRPIIVSIADPLPPGEESLALRPPPASVLPTAPATTPWRAIVFPTWAAGLAILAWLGWGRGRHPQSAVLPGDPVRRELLDGFRAGARSQLTPQTRADLQRRFVGLLIRDFAAPEGSMRDQLQALEEHAAAAPLLEDLDRWIDDAARQATPIPPTMLRYLEQAPPQDATA